MQRLNRGSDRIAHFLCFSVCVSVWDYPIIAMILTGALICQVCRLDNSYRVSNGWTPFGTNNERNDKGK